MSSPLLPSHLSYTFRPFVHNVYGWKYTKSAWYKYELYQYFKSNPTATTAEARLVLESQINTYIKTVIESIRHDWNHKSFIEICSKIKRMIRNGNNIDGPKRCCFNWKQQTTAVQLLESVFDGLSSDETTALLNKYSVSEELPWGESIEAMKSVKWTLRSLTNKYHHKVAQTQKQSVLSSVLRLGSNMSILNKSFMYKITDGKINNCLIYKLREYRWKFDNKQCLYLYDEKFDHKYKEFNKIPVIMKSFMRNWWIEETTPSPIARDSLITDHEMRNANNEKPRHQKHRLRGTIIDFFDEFMDSVGRKKCEQLGIKCPNYTAFYRQMPNFIRVDGKIDYDLCKKCFNFKESLDCYKRTLQRIHTHECDAKCDPGCELRCDCIEYAQITESGILDLSAHEFAFAILCESDSNYPSLKCVQGKCNESKCGTEWLSNLQCETDANMEVNYKQIVAVQKKHSRDRHLILNKQASWSTFISNFSAEIGDFIQHTAAKKYQHLKRSKLTKIIDDKYVLPKNASFQSWDFIANLTIEQANNSSAALMEQVSI